MPLSIDTVTTIPRSSSWAPWKRVSVLGQRFPRTDVFPEGYLPSSTMAFVEEYANHSIELDGNQTAFYGIQYAVLPALFSINYSRIKNSGFVVDSQFFDARPSPRVGFQVGGVFKHQAYVGFSSQGYGVTPGLERTVWLAAWGWPKIEYCTNSRLKTVYLTHGRLAEATYDFEAETMKVKVHTSTNAPLVDRNIGGQIMIWSVQNRPVDDTTPWKPKLYDVTDGGKDWVIQIVDQSQTPTYFAAAGDFFMLLDPKSTAKTGNLVCCTKTGSPDFGAIGIVIDDNGNKKISFGGGKADISYSADYAPAVPWIVEDPATMHEYGLTDLPNGTKLPCAREQYHYSCHGYLNGKSSVGNKIIGVWSPDISAGGTAGSGSSSSSSSESDDFDGLAAYVDAQYQGSVWLPEERDQVYGEWREFGGTMSLGVDKLRNNNWASVDMILDGIDGSSPSYAPQNLMTGTMLGEYVLHGGNMYEVIGHRRGDSIEVKSEASTSRTSILSTMSKTSGAELCHLIQQKFWMISEMYHYNGATKSVSGLWAGPALSSAVTTQNNVTSTFVTWRGSRATLSRMSSKTEREKWAADSLDIRALTQVLDGADGVRISPMVKTSYGNTGKKTYIVQNPGWLLHDRSTQASYPIKELTVILNGDQVQCKAMIEQKAGIKVGETVFILFDTPYTRVSSGLEASFFAKMDFGIAYPPWSLLVSGYYDAGRYNFAGRLENVRFSLVDFSFGYDPVRPYYGLGVPAVFVSVGRSKSSLTMCKHPMTGRQHIFYDDDAQDGLLVQRSAGLDWVNQLEQSAVILGYPNQLSKTSSTVPVDASLIVNPVFQVPMERPQAGQNYSTYWLRTGQEYFGLHVTGGGGINTPLFREYNKISPVTSNTGIYLPVEYYAPVKTAIVPSSSSSSGSGSSSSTSSPSSCLSASYMAANTATSEIGLVKITSAAPVTAVRSGKQLVPSNWDIPFDSAFYCLKNQIIKQARSKEVFYQKDGRISLIYGGELPAHTDADGVDQPLSEAVMFISSDDEAGHWGSPIVTRPKSDTNDLDALTKWSVPLALMRNFNFAGACNDTQGGRIIMFGYVYEEGKENDSESMSLAMYSIGYNTLIASSVSTSPNSTNSAVATIYPVSATTLSPPVAYMRVPKVVAPTPTKVNNGATFYTSSSQSQTGDEVFVKIIGNSRSFAQITGTGLVSNDLIFPSVGSAGEVRILMKNHSNGNIIGIHSKDRGDKWQEDGVIYSYEADAPYMFGNLLFYFQAENLYCKSIGIRGGDTGRNKGLQEIYDSTNSYLVTRNVLPQKIAVQKNNAGEINVHYVRSNGDLGGSRSREGGQNWKTMVNW